MSFSHRVTQTQRTLQKKSLILRQAFCFSFVLLLSGCATYQTKVDDARHLLRSPDKNKAVAHLEPHAKKENDDQLVYLLDYAVALQEARRYKESAQAFEQASRIADVQDYHSLSRIGASLLLSEEMVQYKGDDYEKVLINAVNAINFLMLDDLDAALVEVRRLNEKLYKFKFEAKRNYEQNPYAFYLAAIIWEADRKYDDAYIDYKKTYELMPDYAPLREDLIRAAIKAQRPDELKIWREKFPEVKIRPEWSDRTLGELVVIYQQGWGPRKQSRPESPRFPKLYPVRTSTQTALIDVVPESGAGVQVRTDRIYSVQNTAIKTLDDAYAALVAKRVAGVATKAVVADQIRQKNEALGAIAWIAMNVADRADLRQWSTLPETFQVARIYLKPGRHKVRIKGLTLSGSPSGEMMDEQEITVRPGKKTFMTWRSYN